MIGWVANGTSGMWLRLVLSMAVVAFGVTGAVAADKQTSAQIKANAERRCLTEAMYFEAGSEGEEGMRAVAEVVLRRQITPGFPKTVCKVIRSGLTKVSCEFSYLCDGARRRPRGRGLWMQSWRLAGEILADKKAALAENITEGATHFHASYVSPDWDKLGLVKTVQIGQHIFYRPKDAPAG
jgi:spore germination cell wall hydrolase CwlJ-like protein